jgi:hypothetical protein
MKKLTKEIKEISEVLMYDHPALTVAEAVIIATQIQRNRVLEEAFVVGTSKPTALEAIAMELGAATDGDTIKTALYNLRE